MTIRMGSSTAKGFGDRHEDYPGNPQAEKEMDLHNNGKGREFANSIPWYSLTRDTQTFNKCYFGTQNGALRFF